MSEIVPGDILDHIFNGTDCTFIFPGADDKSVEVHANRSVIDKASGYLRAKFETYKRNTLFILDVPQPVFKIVLVHVYTGLLPESEILDQEMLFQMYEASLKYEFKETLDSLTSRLISNCTMKNIPELLSYLNFALKHYIVAAQSALQPMIECNADIILDSDLFLNAHPRVLNWIYSLNDLNIDEWDLIGIAEKYKAFHGNRHSIVSQIQPAINNIRFLSLTPAQINNSTFLSEDEKECLVLVVNQEASDKSVPMYFTRRRIGRCNKAIKIFCDDDRFKQLYDEDKVKLCTFKGKKYMHNGDGKIVAYVENSGYLVPCEFEDFSPVKEPEKSKTKKVCGSFQQSVFYYKEPRQILVHKKREPTGKNEKEKVNEEAAETLSFRNLSLRKH